MILRIGAIYSLRYTNWKTNYTIYAFVMWPGNAFTKTHLLNIGAKQLSVIDRAKIMRIIVNLSKIPNSSKYTGRVLYTIFKAYMPKEMSKCYRTFHTNLITQAALINYGLNKEEDFSELELNGQSKLLYAEAQRDFQVKAINWYSKRGVDLNKMKDSLAKPTLVETDKEISSDKTTGDNPVNTMSGIKPGTRSAIRGNAVKEEQPEENNDTNKPNDDGSEFGY
jgi:hypothetical protein